MVLTLLKELLNMVYQKGQSWDLYSSASILMTYHYVYNIIININTKKIFYNADIKLHIDYVSAVWDGCNKEHFKKYSTLYIEGQANESYLIFPFYRTKH